MVVSPATPETLVGRLEAWFASNRPGLNTTGATPAEIGVKVERIGIEAATREFFSAALRTYASLSAAVGFLTGLDDGSLIYTEPRQAPSS